MLERPAITLRGLAIICLASGCWAFSFGVSAPSGLCSLWLQAAQCSDTVIGLNSGTYYLGIALAAGLVPWMMRRWGRSAIVVGMVVSGLSVAAFPWAGGLFGWFALRLL